MLNWSNRVTKSITFTREDIDLELLSQIEIELDRHPHKTFSDLCKEALWQLLNTPASSIEAELALSVTTPAVTPISTPADSLATSIIAVPISTKVAAPVVAAPGTSSEMEQIAQLRRQFYDLEQRLLSRESSRFDAIEQQIQYLAQRLDLLENQPDPHYISPNSTPPPSPEPILEAIESADDGALTPEADPLLSRLSQYIDEF